MEELTKLFIAASRQRFRFKTTRANVTIEDLWRIDINELDKLARNLRRELRELEDESFITKKSNKSSLVQKKFDLVKYIITVRLEEVEEKERASERKAQKQQLLSIIEEKQQESLRGKSVEELQKMADQL